MQRRKKNQNNLITLTQMEKFKLDGEGLEQ